MKIRTVRGATTRHWPGGPCSRKTTLVPKELHSFRPNLKPRSPRRHAAHAGSESPRKLAQSYMQAARCPTCALKPASKLALKRRSLHGLSLSHICVGLCLGRSHLVAAPRSVKALELTCCNCSCGRRSRKANDALCYHCLRACASTTKLECYRLSMLSASMGLACRRTQAPDRVAAESCSLHGVCTCSCPIKLGWVQLESELDVELKALQPNYMHYSCGLGRRNLRKSALPWFRTEHQIQGRQRNVSASSCNNSPLLRFVQNLLLATGAALEVSTKEQKPRSKGRARLQNRQVRRQEIDTSIQAAAGAQKGAQLHV